MCPNVVCRKIMSVPVSARGKVVQCPQCRKRIRIPVPTSSTIRDDATDQSAPDEKPEQKKAG